MGGGERRYISAAVSRSRIIMGPPHRGQVHEGVEGRMVKPPSSSSCGCSEAGGKSVRRPRSWKESGKRAARRR